MVDLILYQITQTNPALIPTNATLVDSVRQANVSAEYKQDILELVLREAGPKSVLSIGQGISNVGHDPIWHAAVRSASPNVVFDKWHRFEAYGHSRNRLRIKHTHSKRASFQRYSVGGGKPTTPENLLICGLIIALLEVNGCSGLRCDMPLEGGSTYCVYQDGRFTIPKDISLLNSTTWAIEWQMFSARTNIEKPQAELPDIPMPRTCKSTMRKSVESVARFLVSDVSRQWKVAELAREAGQSTRSLQRQLSEAKLSFSQLVRLVRIHHACHLLESSSAPITGIGYCTGFSDSAHFSRDFRASMGMTPSDYRALF